MPSTTHLIGAKEEIQQNNNKLLRCMHHSFKGYAVFTRHGDIRLLPTQSPQNNRDGSDTLQLGKSLPCEPAGILAKSGDWYYIRTYAYTGWTNKKNITHISRETYEMLLNPKNIAVVTDKSINLHNQVYPMSTVFPYENGRILIPQRQKNSFIWKSSKLKPGMSKGFLPYTRENLLACAVRFLDTPYSWGEKGNGTDCSAYIRSVYGCCGLKLPRNSEEMSTLTAPIYVHRFSDFKNALPGDILHFPGHVMLCLDGRHVIHASYSAGKVCINEKDEIKQ